MENNMKCLLSSLTEAELLWINKSNEYLAEIIKNGICRVSKSKGDVPANVIVKISIEKMRREKSVVN